MNPALRVADSDYISGSAYDVHDVYAVLRHNKIQHVLHGGIAENMCVLQKVGSIPQLHELGFSGILLRDPIDAQNSYNPATFRPPPQPWVHPDWGTRNVTAAIEQLEICVTAEGAELVGRTAWPDNLDPVLHAPWGTRLRPHIFDGFALATLSSWCTMEARIGCHGPRSIHIRYTLDETSPAGSSTLFTSPTNISRSTIISAAGFVDGRQVLKESESVLIRREVGPHTSRADVAPYNLSLSGVVPLWNIGDDDTFRMHAIRNASWLERPLQLPAQTLPNFTRVYPDGLGLRAPMHLNYDLDAVRQSWPLLRRFVATVGIDTGCDKGAPSNAGHSVVDPHYPDAGPAHCHDISEWQRAVVQIFLDGELVQESPVLCAQALVWNLNVLLPRSARLMRIVVLSVGLVADPPGLSPAGVQAGASAQSQNAYDWVDVIGGFAFKSDNEAEALGIRHANQHLDFSFHYQCWPPPHNTTPGGPGFCCRKIDRNFSNQLDNTRKLSMSKLSMVCSVHYFECAEFIGSREPQSEQSRTSGPLAASSSTASQSRSP